VIGAALKVAGARSFAAARWTIPYCYTAAPAANVKGVVMTAAGRIQARILNGSATPMGPAAGTPFAQLVGKCYAPDIEGSTTAM